MSMGLIVWRVLCNTRQTTGRPLEMITRHDTDHPFRELFKITEHKCEFESPEHLTGWLSMSETLKALHKLKDEAVK